MTKFNTSTVWVGTTNKVVARLLDFFDDGDAHMAIVSQVYPGKWLDARFSGIRYRPPEGNLWRSDKIVLPFDIEPAAYKIMLECDGYNFRGVIAKALHFKWNNPKRKFCDQFVLAAINRTVILRFGSNARICDEGEEARVSPWEAKLMIKAALRGMQWTATT